jgi:sirohydrochlorin ferrochelatase
MTEKKAAILMGHGSRMPGAAEDMEHVVEHLKNKIDYDIIEICQMSGLGEHFPEVFDRCVEQGATQVVVLPYFLHLGVHLLVDIPGMMQEKAKEHPGVKVILGKHLGFDETLVDLVAKRIGESESLCDVRDMKLEGKEKLGKCEHGHCHEHHGHSH